MASNKIGCLPVMESGELIGAVNQKDLLKIAYNENISNGFIWNWGHFSKFSKRTNALGTMLII